MNFRKNSIPQTRFEILIPVVPLMSLIELNDQLSENLAYLMHRYSFQI